jgi:short-subunit dehydrogenase
MAGLVNPPNMGVYNVSKHAVVSLTETLHHDLQLVTTQIGVSVMCPFFVATGISQSQRNRPGPSGKPTLSQKVGAAMMDKAVKAGKVSAAEVAEKTFAAIAARQFYIYSHPKALASVRERLLDVVEGRTPADPFEGRAEVREQLKAALRGE